jgi:hypothetical protein
MTKYYGLCETCDYDDTCNLRRFSQLKVIQCEEFSIQPSPSMVISVRDPAMHSDPVAISRMGLCVNCQHILTCGFPNSRQNVLQCEEYMLDESGIQPSVQAEPSRSAA